VPELQVIARYTVRAGEEDEVLSLLGELAEVSRTEPGNVSFVAYRSLDEGHEIVLLERYASRAAFAAHRETPHFKDLVLSRIAPRLDSRVVDTYDAPA
jgi:quinol monooxygenase YgiN